MPYGTLRIAKPLTTIKMKHWTPIIILVLIQFSCTQKQNDKSKMPLEYSEEFKSYFEKSNLTLKSDSITFPKESGIEDVVIIPSYIPRKKSISFESETKDFITITQINYTDIEFAINYLGDQIQGKASLYPQFYRGFETIVFSDGEYIINYYYVTDCDNECIDFIGLGNINIAKESPENVYAMISVSGGVCENELNNLTNKKLTTVANTK